MLHNLSDLRGIAIGATDGDIGSVQDVYFDDEKWKVRYFVVDTGSWLPGRLVLLSPEAVTELDLPQRELKVNLTQMQVEDSPDIESHKPVSRQREVEIRNYYGWPIYWPQGAVESRAMQAIAERPEDSHLNSAHDVAGYALHARDGKLGHVEDFLVDDETWDIRYLVIDTRNWWPGKKVVISPRWIDSIDWSAWEVRTDLGRDEVKNSPEYDPSVSLDRQYEVELHEHYGRPLP